MCEREGGSEGERERDLQNERKTEIEIDRKKEERKKQRGKKRKEQNTERGGKEETVYVREIFRILLFLENSDWEARRHICLHSSHAQAQLPRLTARQRDTQAGP